MNRISLPTTRFHKKVMPVVMLSLFSAVFVVAFFSYPVDPTFVSMILVIMFVLAIDLALMRRLADEVIDEGAWLRVRKGDVEERVMLSDIREIRVSFKSNPTRMTLYLRNFNQFDGEVVFIPRSRGWSLFGKHPLAKELETRIESSRKELRSK